MDGFSDHAEVFGGSLPTNDLSRPRFSLRIGPGTYAHRIVFPGMNGAAYDIETSGNLTDWRNTGTTAVGTGNLRALWMPVGEAQGSYYRAQEMAP
jgi:hypothetical protein